MKNKSSLSLELEGNVYIVETKNGKKIKKEKLDGEIVLKSLIYLLESSLDYVLKNENQKH